MVAIFKSTRDDVRAELLLSRPTCSNHLSDGTRCIDVTLGCPKMILIKIFRSGRTYIDGVLDPVMVRDGTKCGDGKVCHKQKCVSETSSGTNAKTCPVVGGSTCAGNGVRDHFKSFVCLVFSIRPCDEIPHFIHNRRRFFYAVPQKSLSNTINHKVVENGSHMQS
jgi:hypothetical protein